MRRFIYALDPFSITDDHEKALEIALEYFDRVFGTDAAGHERIEIAVYDYNDTHAYPEAPKKNAYVYLIKGSPNRGVAIVRDLSRYYSISVDAIENSARIYVLKDSSRITDFRSKAYYDFIVDGIFFPSKRVSFRHDDLEINVETGPAYSRVTIKPANVEVRPIEQRWPVSIVRRGDTIKFSIPTFSVPFALFDVVENSEKDFLARLIRSIYGRFLKSSNPRRVITPVLRESSFTLIVGY